jgi:formate dehydrogenase gamma subunit
MSDRKDTRDRDLVTRFNRFERGQHLAVMVLFSILAVTGFPQKFHEGEWAHWLVSAMGGISQVRHLHRLAGGMFAGLAMIHLGSVIAAVLARRSSLAMVPTRKDFQDSVNTLRYYLRSSDQHPQFDRFDYREKFEYWGIVMGGIIMMSTGFVLLFPMQATQWLPGEVVPAAKLAHSNEGMMAFLVVITWHIYNAHFAPEVFPFNKSIFTGKISREHMREHHGLEYARRFPDQSKDRPSEAPEPGKET